MSGHSKCTVILAAIMLLPAIALKAQEKEWLFLKDRTEIWGEISRQPDGGVCIVDQYGDEFVFAADEIRYIASQKQKDWAERTLRRKGYFGIVETSLGFFDPGVLFSLEVINGYKVSPYFYLGLGLGVGTYSTDIVGRYVFNIPIYAHFRYSIIGGRDCAVSPYIAFDIGLDNSVARDFTFSDLYINLSLGVEVRSYKLGTLWLGLAFPCHEYYIGGLALKVGYSF